MTTTLRPAELLPRNSSSSSRSRLTEADFEQALAKADTLFLSAGPSIHADQHQVVERDEDAPDPIEKRSFDQDYRSTPKMESPGVLPPTPTSLYNRRDSRATTTSTDSAPRQQRYQQLKAIGLDEEVALEDAQLNKKKSIFRSPGTASSPDLATLVKRAKEARGKNSPSKLVKSGSGMIPSPSSASISTFARDRSVSQVTVPDETRSFASGSTERMATISETSSRRRQNSEEGFKSMRNKARGVLGRMFGNGPSPPVPPVPQSYAQEAERRRGSDVFGQVQSPAIPAPTADRRLATHVQTPAEAVPSTLHRVSSPLEKPLPVIRNPSPTHAEQRETIDDHVREQADEQALSPAPRKSQHIRQPASADDTHPSPGQLAVAIFSDDMAGMLSGIGESQPAKELGLPPESLRLRDRKSPSFDIPREKFPPDLGRSASSAVSVPSRTSSLLKLEPPVRSLSRSSSSSSRRRPETDFGPTDTSQDATLKARVAPSPYSSGSMRLVPSRQSVHAPSLGEPIETEDEEEKGRRLACEFLENDESTLPYDKVAEYLGGPRSIHRTALKYYMQYFDMKGQNLVDSFRDLCKKLHLKAESQEIDRIIEAFSTRYFECNPSTVFGTPGVVHTVTGAMLMLNTDLHIADLSKHMSRADFVRNAMRAIQESAPGDEASTPDLVEDTAFGSNSSMTTSSAVGRPREPPPPQRSASGPVMLTDNAKSSVGSFSKAWEVDAENALKDIYASVRADRILLPTNDTAPNRKRQSVISVGDFSRNRTIRSPSGGRVNTLKRGSVFGAQSLLNQPFGDGRLSPTPSYATSINETFGYTATIGFASNLSHAVIREQEDETHSIASRSSVDTLEDMTDDELALLGAPWAKEGLLNRKLYWESLGKRAKKNDWKQLFVVIQKGELMMFVFGQGSGSTGGTVGGGNWMTNANPVGSVSLMHTMAVALPKPGYNASRPHCFSLALPTGETSFFQAGTEDLVGEWVAACNYWAARTSRQPLQGGVSNMEYGWNRVDSPATDDDKASVRSSRSSLFSGTYSRKGGLPADKIFVNDWKPPPAAGMSSPLDEESQLEALSGYVKSLVEELENHKAVEEPMSKIFTPGTKNAAKAKENWKAKSHYIHTEIYKYETYLDALRNAISLRVKKQGERKLEKSLRQSVGSLHLFGGGEDREITPKR